jgi:hypothetical protein
MQTYAELEDEHVKLVENTTALQRQQQQKQQEIQQEQLKMQQQQALAMMDETLSKKAALESEISKLREEKISLVSAVMSNYHETRVANEDRQRCAEERQRLVDALAANLNTFLIVNSLYVKETIISNDALYRSVGLTEADGFVALKTRVTKLMSFFAPDKFVVVERACSAAPEIVQPFLERIKLMASYFTFLFQTVLTKSAQEVYHGNLKITRGELFMKKLSELNQYVAGYQIMDSSNTCSEAQKKVYTNIFNLLERYK